MKAIRYIVFIVDGAVHRNRPIVDCCLATYYTCHKDYSNRVKRCHHTSPIRMWLIWGKICTIRRLSRLYILLPGVCLSTLFICHRVSNKLKDIHTINICELFKSSSSYYMIWYSIERSRSIVSLYIASDFHHAHLFKRPQVQFIESQICRHMATHRCLYIVIIQITHTAAVYRMYGRVCGCDEPVRASLVADCARASKYNSEFSNDCVDCVRVCVRCDQ